MTIVGLGVDNLLFAIDPTTADIRWRRPLETASITCPDSARIAADGEFFTVYGRTFAQPFHARTGVPLGARATPGGFAAVAAGTEIDAVLITATGDVAVRIGERIYIRRRPAPSSSNADDLERFTGIDSTDGLTPLNDLSVLTGAATP